MVSINLDISLVIQLVNFLLLILALNYLLYRPIRQVLAERRELMNRLKTKASKARAELENGEAEKARLNAESLRQALQHKNEITAKAAAEDKILLAEAQEQAARQVNDSRARLQQSASAARAVLTQDIQRIAKDMADKILGRTI